MKNFLKETTDAYLQAAIGQHVHCPINMIFQGVDATRAAGVFQFQADAELIKKLTEQAELHNRHVLWMGDAFFRSKAVVESPHLQGQGISGIYMTGFSDITSWIKKGKILKGP